MKIDEVNNTNVYKYLDGYPENVKTALRNLHLCLCCKDTKHIVRFYKIGYFGVPDGLQREVEIKQNPLTDILKKYYPELGYLGNVSMTFSVHEDTGRISPAYYDNDTERYYSFAEEMMGNTAMWNEMANVKPPAPTVEYAEELSLDTQYAEWKQKQRISNSNIEAKYINKLKNKETSTYRLCMVALTISLVALIINLIIKFVI